MYGKPKDNAKLPQELCIRRDYSINRSNKGGGGGGGIRYDT